MSHIVILSRRDYFFTLWRGECTCLYRNAKFTFSASVGMGGCFLYINCGVYLRITSKTGGCVCLSFTYMGVKYVRKKSWEKPSFTHGTSKKDKTALDKLVFKCSCQGCEHDYKILDSDVNKVRSDDELHFVTGNVIFYCSKCLDVKHIELDEMN